MWSLDEGVNVKLQVIWVIPKLGVSGPRTRSRVPPPQLGECPSNQGEVTHCKEQDKQIYERIKRQIYDVI